MEVQPIQAHRMGVNLAYHDDGHDDTEYEAALFPYSVGPHEKES